MPLPDHDLIQDIPGLPVLLGELGGSPLNGGIYRLFEAKLFEAANDFIASAFPAWLGSMAPFGSDWMGRIFAVDGSGRRAADGERCVLLLDPATRDLIQVPAGVTAFHNETLIDETDLAVEEELWKSWLSTHQSLSYEDVVGWRVPGFLGGELTLENLDIQPARVYWDISGQLIAQTFKLKPGTRIKGVKIE